MEIFSQNCTNSILGFGRRRQKENINSDIFKEKDFRKGKKAKLKHIKSKIGGIFFHMQKYQLLCLNTLN